MGARPANLHDIASTRSSLEARSPSARTTPHGFRPLGFRWHGRGGQGAVTASRVLTEAALLAGFYPQSLPDFGAERSGAPIAVYTRIGVQPSFEKGHVVEPDVVVVLDPSLLGHVEVLAGLREGGVLVVNTTLPPAALREKLPGPYGSLCTVDGSGIAVRLLGRNVPNIPVLGAVARVIPLVPLDRIKEAVEKRFRAGFPPHVLAANMTALERGCREAVVAGTPWR